MNYLLNSAVITSPGLYDYTLISVEQARWWMKTRKWKSTIRYRETVIALSGLVGIDVKENDEIIKMKPEDQALVFRLVFPRGSNRIPKDAKGNLSTQFVLDNHEIGVLTRIS